MPCRHSNQGRDYGRDLDSNQDRSLDTNQDPMLGHPKPMTDPIPKMGPMSKTDPM